MLPSVATATVLAVAVATPVVLIGGALAIQAVKTSYWLWRWRHVPGPPPHLILGNLSAVRKAGGSHIAIMEWRKRYGPVFKMYFLSRVFIVVCDPDMAKTVLNRCVNHTEFSSPSFQIMRGKLKEIDTKGLLQARDQLWRSLRTAWQPAFAPSSLAAYWPCMLECAQALTKRLQPTTTTDIPITTNNAVLKQRSAPLEKQEAEATPDSGPNGVGHNLNYVEQVHGNLEHPQIIGNSDNRGQIVDIYELLSRMTLDVVGSTAYGVEFGALKEPGNSQPDVACAAVPITPQTIEQEGPILFRACKDLFASTTMQGSSKWGLIYLLLPTLQDIVAAVARTFPDKAFTRMVQARHDLVDASQRLMDRWRARAAAPASKNASIAGVDTCSTPSTRPLPADGLATAVNGLGKVESLSTSSGIAPGSFLGLLLSAQHRLGFRSEERLNDIVIAAQCVTFFLAGTETTANTLAFTIYLVSQNPKVEARLLEELKSHGLGKPVRLEDKLPYLDGVINEALRMYPPAHATTRDIQADEGMTFGQFHFPKGTGVLVPLYSLNNDPDVWPRATEFLPERWLSENVSELGPKNPASYVPFGGGTRQCPGMRFALQEARLVIGLLYSHFAFEVVPEQVPLKISAGITLMPKEGLKVKVIPRPSVTNAVVG